MSVKIQAASSETVAAQLRREAKQQNVPVAELIRHTMQEHLQRERAKVLHDPFGNIDSIGDPGESDLASRVDEIYDK